MRDRANHRRFVASCWVAAVVACGAASSEAETSSGSVESSSGASEATTVAIDTSAGSTTSTGEADERGSSDTIFEPPPDLGNPAPTCGPCSASEGRPLDPQEPPGGDTFVSATQLADGRVLVAWYEYEDGRVSARFYDPASDDWDDASLLRHAGSSTGWMKAYDSPAGPVVVEGGYNDLHAHLFDGTWNDMPLVLPSPFFIWDLQEAPDGSKAALVSYVASDIDQTLLLARFDPETRAWEAETVFSDPFDLLFGAYLAFASDDGDALVGVDNGESDRSLHHRDSATGTWTMVDRGPSGFNTYESRPTLREIEPGEFLYSRSFEALASPGAPSLYTFSEEDGVNHLVGVPFPDDYVDGVLYSVQFDGETLSHRTYTLDLQTDEVDTLDLGLDLTDTWYRVRLLAGGGHAYAVWVTPAVGAHAAVHQDGGWTSPIELPWLISSSEGWVYLARNDAGDVIVTQAPYLQPDATVSLYSEEEGCWHPTTTLGGTAVKPLPLKNSRDFLLLGLVGDRAASVFSCEP